MPRTFDILENNTPEETVAYKAGVEQGKKHATPSEGTIKMFDKFGEKFDKLSDKSNEHSVVLGVISKSTKNTEIHLKELNGSVAENTGFRKNIMGGFAVISFIGLGSIVGIVLLWISMFNNNNVNTKIAELEQLIEINRINNK